MFSNTVKLAYAIAFTAIKLFVYINTYEEPKFRDRLVLYDKIKSVVLTFIAMATLCTVKKFNIVVVIVLTVLVIFIIRKRSSDKAAERFEETVAEGRMDEKIRKEARWRKEVDEQEEERNYKEKYRQQAGYGSSSGSNYQYGNSAQAEYEEWFRNNQENQSSEKDNGTVFFNGCNDIESLKNAITNLQRHITAMKAVMVMMKPS